MYNVCECIILCPSFFCPHFLFNIFFYYCNFILKKNPLCQSFIHSLNSQDFCFVRKLLSCIVNDLKVPKRQHWKTVQAHGVCKFDNASKVSYFPIWLFPNEIDFHSQNYHWWRVWHVIGDISYEFKKNKKKTLFTMIEKKMKKNPWDRV